MLVETIGKQYSAYKILLAVNDLSIYDKYILNDTTNNAVRVLNKPNINRINKRQLFQFTSFINGQLLLR